ncbi:MAG: response regulator [Deltaproteobacteria bacterium]|nr:response regulator [Deltaproteobacteria bacterium]
MTGIDNLEDKGIAVTKGADDGHRVMIVDSDRFLAETLADILSEEAVKVAICQSGGEALKAVRNYPYGIAIIDVRLPDMSGIDLLRQFIEIAPDIDIVIVTGNASVHSAMEALNHGASRYILKPCAPDELLSIVNDLFERQQLRERNRLYLRRLEVQNRLSHSLSSALLPKDVARAAVQAATGIAEVRAATVIIYRDPNNRDGVVDTVADPQPLQALAWTGVGDDTVDTMTAMPEVRQYLDSRVLAHAAPGMVALPPGQDPENPASVCPVALYRLKGRTSDLGVLAVIMDNCENNLDEQNEELLSVISNWVGVAMERAILHHRLEIAYADVKNAQKQLVYAEKQAAIGRLAAGLAHEVGTPLNIISGRAELLLEDSGIDPDTAQALQVIVQQIERLSSLIRQLLDFSREYSPARQKIDLEGVINAVVSLMEVQLKKRHIKLSLEIDDGLPRVVANFNQLQQVFINLLMNSIDAIGTKAKNDGAKSSQSRKPSGRIFINANYLPSSRQVQIVIADSGQGIREDDLDKVFEPFFTTKDVGAGTGLGLAVVYGIITDHGGSIDIESSWAKGTAVTFNLPTETTETAAATKKDGSRNTPVSF